jgi:hypothetical protein
VVFCGLESEERIKHSEYRRQQPQNIQAEKIISSVWPCMQKGDLELLCPPSPQISGALEVGLRIGSSPPLTYLGLAFFPLFLFFPASGIKNTYSLLGYS